MPDTVFIHAEFWGLVAVSLAIPVAVVVLLLRASTISRARLIASAVVFLALAGLDVGLLGQVRQLTKATASVRDDPFFLSEYSVALYLLPYLSAGIGINLLTFAMTQHLKIKGVSPDA